MEQFEDEFDEAPDKGEEPHKSNAKGKTDTIVTSNQYLRQGEFDKIVDYGQVSQA